MVREDAYLDRRLVKSGLGSLRTLSTELSERIDFECMLLEQMDELEYDIEKLRKHCTELLNELEECKEEKEDLLEEATAFKEYVEKTFLQKGEQIIRDDEMQFSIYPEREE